MRSLAVLGAFSRVVCGAWMRPLGLLAHVAGRLPSTLPQTTKLRELRGGRIAVSCGDSNNLANRASSSAL